MNKIIDTEEACSLFPEARSEAVLIASGSDYEYQTCSNQFDIWKYDTSGLCVLDPRPRCESLDVIYPDNYEPYNFDKMGVFLTLARNLVQKKKVRQLSEFLFDDARVLDIGCGNGALLKGISAYSKTSVELHANDIHVPSLEVLSLQGITVHQCDCSEIKLNDYFDVIILNQVIEHFSAPGDVLMACHRLLKPNGILYIETPSTDGMDAKIFKDGAWGGYHFPRHFYLFNESNLSEYLESHGFSIKKVGYLLSPAFWTQSLHHFIYRLGWKKIAQLFHLKNIPLTVLVTLVDLVVILLGFKTSNMRVVCRKVVQSEEK